MLVCGRRAWSVVPGSPRAPNFQPPAPMRLARRGGYRAAPCGGILAFLLPAHGSRRESAGGSTRLTTSRQSSGSARPWGYPTPCTSSPPTCSPTPTYKRGNAGFVALRVKLLRRSTMEPDARRLRPHPFDCDPYRRPSYGAFAYPGHGTQATSFGSSRLMVDSDVWQSAEAAGEGTGRAKEKEQPCEQSPNKCKPRKRSASRLGRSG
jgi:hypothetical protein